MGTIIEKVSVSSGKIYIICDLEDVFLYEIYGKSSNQTAQKNIILKYIEKQKTFKNLQLINLYNFYNWQIKIFGFIAVDINKLVRSFIKTVDYEDYTPVKINKIFKELGKQSKYMKNSCEQQMFEDLDNYDEFNTFYQSDDGCFYKYTKTRFLDRLENSLQDIFLTISIKHK